MHLDPTGDPGWWDWYFETGYQIEEDRFDKSEEEWIEDMGYETV